jgi:CPA1 family monovalent cation:H+ antiporter
LYQALPYQITTSAAAIAIVLLGRAVSVYGVCGILHFTRLRIKLKHQHALVWGGLRGALALALALGLPEAMPYRSEIVETSFAVVAFSVFAQGLTIAPFLRAIGELPKRVKANAA